MNRSAVAVGLVALVSVVGCAGDSPLTIPTSTPPPASTPSTSFSPSTSPPEPPAASSSGPEPSPAVTTVPNPSSTPATLAGTRTPTNATSEPAGIPAGKDYGSFPDRDLSWWYRPPTPWGQERPAGIDADVAALIEGHDVIWRGATGRGTVHLTMDEGYEYETNTTEILDIAASKGVPITFFITGSYLERNPALVRRMVEEGHQVANHSVRHLRPPAALADSAQTFADDVVGLEKSYLEEIGEPISRLYRPPEGGYSERSLELTDDLGYTTVFWSFAYHDWDTADQPAPAEALERILGELHDGSVLLLHAVSDTNVDILPAVIDGIRARGYEFVLLPAPG